MNNIFNLTRFCRLFVKHTVEHYKSYLMSLAVLIGVMILGGSFLVYMIEAPIDRGFQTAIFSMILFLAGTIFTSTVFAGYGDKKKAISLLTLPASHFEKYLVAWLYSFLIFSIVYSVCFYLVVLLAINVKHFPGHPSEIINILRWPVCGMFVLYAFLHSVAFLGAIFFEKLHFIKTAFLFFISLMLLIIANKILLGTLIGEKMDTPVPFGYVRLRLNGQAAEIGLTSFQDNWLILIISVLALIFWVAAYYRLKEKQV